MNQTTNFTILSRIWNHDFYITQKSNFCTGSQILEQKGVLRKNIFLQTGFYSQLKQFSLTFEAMLMWFPSGFVGCTTDLTMTKFIIGRDWWKKMKRKEKETKEILPIYLSSRSSARCLLRWALRILLPNSYDFPATWMFVFVKIWMRDSPYSSKLFLLVH